MYTNIYLDINTLHWIYLPTVKLITSVEELM